MVDNSFNKWKLTDMCACSSPWPMDMQQVYKITSRDLTFKTSSV